jgi:hypothetical protein
MKKYAVLFEEFISDPAQEASLKKQFATNNLGDIPVTHSVSQVVSNEDGTSVEHTSELGNIVDMTDKGTDPVEEAERPGLDENLSALKSKYAELVAGHKFGYEDLKSLDADHTYRGTADKEVNGLGLNDKKDLIKHVQTLINSEWG